MGLNHSFLEYISFKTFELTAYIYVLIIMPSRKILTSGSW